MVSVVTVVLVSGNLPDTLCTAPCHQLDVAVQSYFSTPIVSASLAGFLNHSGSIVLVILHTLLDNADGVDFRIHISCYELTRSGSPAHGRPLFRDRLGVVL